MELSFPRTLAPKSECTIGGTFATCNNMYQSLKLLPPYQYKKHISVAPSTKEAPNVLSALLL